MFNQLSTVGQLSTVLASFCVVLFVFYFFIKVLGFNLSNKSTNPVSKDSIDQMNETINKMCGILKSQHTILEDMKSPFYKMSASVEHLEEMHNVIDNDGAPKWWVKNHLYTDVHEIKKHVERLLTGNNK